MRPIKVVLNDSQEYSTNRLTVGSESLGLNSAINPLYNLGLSFSSAKLE